MLTRDPFTEFDLYTHIPDLEDVENYPNISLNFGHIVQTFWVHFVNGYMLAWTPCCAKI